MCPKKKNDNYTYRYTYTVRATRRFVPRAAFTVAQEGKIEQVCNANRSPQWIVGAKWRLETAKNTAAMLQENSPDGTCTYE